MLRGSLRKTELASVEYALVENAPRRAVLRANLSGTYIPSVTETEAQLGSSSASAVRAPLRRMRTNWQLYLQRYGPALLAANSAGEQNAAIDVRRLLDRLLAGAETLADHEAAQAAATLEQTTASADSTRTRLFIVALIGGLAGIGIASVLTRSIVRRTRKFSRFGRTVAKGS